MQKTSQKSAARGSTCARPAPWIGLLGSLWLTGCSGAPVKAAEPEAPVGEMVSRVPPTGIQYCYGDRRSGSRSFVACTDPATVALNDRQDGMGKPGATTLHYSALGNHPVTDCVHDPLTGLTWEGKRDSGKLKAMIDDHGLLSRRYQPVNVPTPGTRGNTDAYSYYGDARTQDDAITYVAEVNAMRLCGYSDWRLPRVSELLGLVDFGKGVKVPQAYKGRFDQQANVRTEWFPNTMPGEYLAAEPQEQTRMWCVAFATGYVYGCNRIMEKNTIPIYVRLVRSDSDVLEGAQRYRYLTDERGRAGGWVQDLQTRLVWRRCPEPQRWNGQECTGKAGQFSYPQSLSYANGQRGWRLPDIKELETLLEREFNSTTLNPQAFPAPQNDDFWSGSLCAVPENGYANGWALSGGGNVYCDQLGFRMRIRLVRDVRS